MSTYYNEHDPYAAQWLRNLIAAGMIADGDVDDRDLREVQPDDLRGYRQCHFFAGIGGWSLALRLAGIPDDYPIWSGSPPCQPFSVAGKQRGTDDDRHLWPAFFDLIRECRPAVIVGEQVASAIAHGWYDTLCDDLEGEGYACGAVIAPACGIGAPHIRERLFWVADSSSARLEGWRVSGNSAGERSAGASGLAGGLEHSNSDRRTSRRASTAPTGHGHTAHPTGPATERASALDGFWRDPDWIFCRDGKWRPVEPGTQPLAHGLPARVGKLRAYGNAVVPQVAAQFVMAFYARGAA